VGCRKSLSRCECDAALHGVDLSERSESHKYPCLGSTETPQSCTRTKRGLRTATHEDALERIIFRLSTSQHRDVFILKGALLFELWTHERRRPTRDADFLASGDNSPERFAGIFREICSVEIAEDGLRFDRTSVKAERIKEDADYEGVRVTFTGTLDKAQIPIQIDIGFGDTVTPAPVRTEYPTLLDLPHPHLLAYPRETVISEKLETMVKLGITNSRMKDFHDLHTLSSTFEFDGKTLADAVRATFEQRKTEWPSNDVPLAFTAEFYEDQNKIKQWRAYLNKNKAYVAQSELKDITDRLASFLVPMIRSAQETRVRNGVWIAAQGWKFN
jgi:Nucleotidyl transferase AbiEii toxin, Type IV TA system